MQGNLYLIVWEFRYFLTCATPQQNQQEGPELSWPGFLWSREPINITNQHKQSTQTINIDITKTTNQIHISHHHRTDPLINIIKEPIKFAYHQTWYMRRNHITLLFEPVDADEALFVRTQSLVHWDVACVWSQTRCLTKCETITSLGMCGVCQKDNVTLSRRLLCNYSTVPFCPPPHQPCECCRCCENRRCPSWKCVREHLF